MNINATFKIEDIFSFLNIPIDTPIIFYNINKNVSDFFVVINSSVKEYIFTENYVNKLIKNNKIIDKIEDDTLFIMICYCDFGVFFVKIGYRKNNRFYFHNKNGPSYVEFYNEYKIKVIDYFENNFYHRFGGPAAIVYDLDGKLVFEKYCIRGKIHNSIGPAIREFYNRKIWNNSFYINDKKISRDEFCKRFNKNFK